MAGGAVIVTRELRKKYGRKYAVDGLNLEVPQGSICGFLGRNGAGKTTTLKMLIGNTLLNWLSFMAVALASAGFPPQAGGVSSGLMYTLSMPVDRRKVAGVRISLGMIEIAAAALVSSLLVCALTPLVGQSFPVSESLVHALLAVAGVTSFYGLRVLLSAERTAQSDCRRRRAFPLRHVHLPGERIPAI